MKKLIILLVLVISGVGNSQCPAPTNLWITSSTLTTVTLTWAENGTAQQWEILVVPDFTLDSTIPTSGGIVTSANPYVLVDLPPTSSCIAIFVRAICSSMDDVSTWAILGTAECPEDVLDHMDTLATDSFSLDYQLQLYPNPAKDILQLTSTSKIDTITVFDTVGKRIMVQHQDNKIIHIENLPKGIYIVEIQTEGKKMFRKFIKE